MLLMANVVGTGDLSAQPASIKPPSSPDTYLGVAYLMMEGVKVLANARPIPAVAHALLAAHTLECALKAYLSRDGSDSAVRAPKLRHNLNKLWEMASKDGLTISRSPPDWAKGLSHVHDSPYYLRYSTKVHVISTPPVEPMTSELRSLLESVTRQVRQRGPK